MNFETVRDCIMIGINQLIKYCDGSETEWGRRPYLIGWDKTAKLKLNSLKSELSMVASSFFEKYNISPMWQVLFSLVPSAIVYASINNKQTIPQTNNDQALEDLSKILDNK